MTHPPFSESVKNLSGHYLSPSLSLFLLSLSLCVWFVFFDIGRLIRIYECFCPCIHPCIFHNQSMLFTFSVFLSCFAHPSIYIIYLFIVLLSSFIHLSVYLLVFVWLVCTCFRVALYACMPCGEPVLGTNQRNRIAFLRRFYGPHCTPMSCINSCTHSIQNSSLCVSPSPCPIMLYREHGNTFESQAFRKCPGRLQPRRVQLCPVQTPTKNRKVGNIACKYPTLAHTHRNRSRATYSYFVKARRVKEHATEHQDLDLVVVQHHVGP